MGVGFIGWGSDCITDSFNRLALAGTPIPGRITETGGKTWNVTDGSDWQVFPLGSAACVLDWPEPRQVAVAWLDADFSDGTIHADVGPIGETNNPAFRDGLVFRYVDDDNYWTFFNYRSPAGTLQYYLRCYSGGSLGYDSGALTTGARDTGGPIPLEVVLDGTSIAPSYDGIPLTPVTSSTHLSATKHGMASLGYGITYFSACPVEEE